MQSDLLPSACMVELPSNPHRGRSASVGGFSKDLMLSLAAQFRNGLLAIKPDVFEFVLCHGFPFGRNQKRDSSGKSDFQIDTYLLDKFIQEQMPQQS